MAAPDTNRLKRTVLVMLAGASLAWAQEVSAGPGQYRGDWRRIGNSAAELNLASPATGAVERVWYSQDGSKLFARVSSGLVYESADFENWRPSQAGEPASDDARSPAVTALPEAKVRLRASASNAGRLYAFGKQVYRSEDQGQSWSSLTAYRGESIIGPEMNDLAVSPRDGEELVVANARGVWRSLDGGLSWTGLNQTLPNLPVRRLAALPSGMHGARIVVGGVGELEWAPGEKLAWRLAANSSFETEAASRQRFSRAIGIEVTAVATVGDWTYAGGVDGSLWVSTSRGQYWRASRAADGARIEGLYADASEPRLAIAVRGGFKDGPRTARVLRTANGGLFWDDLSANLPEVTVRAAVVHRASSTVYLATDAGVWFGVADLSGGSVSAAWSRMGGNLPARAAFDVRLDAGGNQLFVALDGYGVFATMAPHRLRELRVVNAADFSARAAAPGTLLSVLGARVQSARAGDLNAPVLAISDTESQIQVPFEAQGSTLSLAMQAAQGPFTVGLVMESASPAIFVDRDGAPMLLDADSGVLLDGMKPARSGARMQILATGLGRVRPDWPTGVAAPLDEPPRVVAPVRAYLDRMPIDVTRATLAPGYVGFYLIEVQLPALVNSGPAELYIDADGRQSNRVPLYIEP
jgi:uncharacterized protein (TIGR03437 family)